MRELIAGEGGSVLVAGARSAAAVALACEDVGEPTSTPSGVPVYPTDQLPDDLDIDVVRLVACEETTEIAVTAWAASRGVDLQPMRVDVLKPPPGVRVVAVSSASTGSGKTAVTRRVARTLARSGVGVAVARHPIVSLLAWNRFDVSVVRTPPDVNLPRPIDEREELGPVVGTGVPVITGLDPERVLAYAAREAEDGGVVVWDGGGAAMPWITWDVHLHVIDLLRGAPDRRWDRPSDRVRSADVVVLTKADTTGDPDGVKRIEAAVRDAHPGISVILADLAVGVQPVNVLADKRVVIVEDARSLMLGGLAAGAGAVAARRFRCGVVDPRPFAVGAIATALRAHEHIGAVIPSLGRTPSEIDDLAASVYATPGDAVLWASNADPAFVIPDEARPIVRAYGELTEVAGPPLQDVLSSLLPGHD